jgi:hypothetical protein
MSTDHGFYRPQSLAALPSGGLEVTIEAKPSERRGLAVFLDIPDVNFLRAKLLIQHWRGHGVRVTGALEADIVETCVVTLEPLRTKIGANVDRKFLPESMLEQDTEPHELLLDPDGDDPPDPLPHVLDLGELAAEELALNLDPYPRKEGVDAANNEPEPDLRGESPFAKLRTVLKP